jgi:hypothetical protein
MTPGWADAGLTVAIGSRIEVHSFTSEFGGDPGHRCIDFAGGRVSPR